MIDVQLMSPAEKLLGRLDGLRQTGPDRWIARCPAHDGKHPSLAIRVTDAERVLVYCFSGCPIESILGGRQRTRFCELITQYIALNYHESNYMLCCFFLVGVFKLLSIGGQKSWMQKRHPQAGTRKRREFRFPISRPIFRIGDIFSFQPGSFGLDHL